MGNCILINDLVSTKLVAVPKISGKAIPKVMVEENLMTAKCKQKVISCKMTNEVMLMTYNGIFLSDPHFLIIHSTRKIDDFSVNPSKSPIIATYPASHTSLGRRSPWVWNTDGSVTLFEEMGGMSMYKCNFDDQQPVMLSSQIQDHGPYLKFATQNGRLFVHGSYKGI